MELASLVELASSRGRKTNKNIKLGICGEHGGDPKSIEFCSRTGLNYVSCSPFRVPVAKISCRTGGNFKINNLYPVVLMFKLGN